ncbi:MAG: hypothetical protein WEB00_08395 [Dehalococcoidia bacterium]
MKDSFRDELARRLASFAKGTASLDQFRDWYEEAVYDAALPAGDDGWEMLLYLSEFDRGHRTEAELRKAARARANALSPA